MAMVVGSVTVNSSTGNYTGTGATKAVMDVLDAQQTYPGPGDRPAAISVADWAAICLGGKIAIRNQIAGNSRAICALILYIQANAELDLTQNSIQGGVPAAAGTTVVAAPVIG